MTPRPWLRQLARGAALLALSLLALQGCFALRIAAMRLIDPQSTAFQRTEAWRRLGREQAPPWRQQWVDYEAISPHLKRAVIASEDAGFAEHSGIEWDAIERAWDRNLRADDRPDAKLVGGSTITQQLAKNLFLAGERNLLRKGQELAIALLLEALLDKRRILELYLNNVEWGEGVFGAQAAAQRYFRSDAASLEAFQSARLAVMLPAPKRFEKRPASRYVSGRAATIVARMGAVHIP